MAELICEHDLIFGRMLSPETADYPLNFMLVYPHFSNWIDYRLSVPIHVSEGPLADDSIDFGFNFDQIVRKAGIAFKQVTQ